MSRYTKEKDGEEIAYGHDHVTGYFFQIFDKEKGKKEDDYLIFDGCSTFSGMSKMDMYQLMITYDCEKDYCNKVLMDLPF